jgi:hypothetical protein
MPEKSFKKKRLSCGLWRFREFCFFFQKAEETVFEPLREA